MNIVLLSGGSGQRLWPISNKIRSKQFIKFLRSDTGEYESMIQRVFRQIKKADPEANVVIATSNTQLSIIKSQLKDKVNISIEPYRKDTFPAIALASAYLVDVLGKSKDDAVVFCPVDPYVDDSFFKAITELYNHVMISNSNISLIGIEPSFPSEKYGYIIPKNKQKISQVCEFKEKPTKESAKKYIKQGALWNGGVFGFKLKYILDKSKTILGTCDYKKLYDNYENLTKISFDYAVVEKENNIDVLKFGGLWKDIGTWSSLTEVINDNIIGNGFFDDKCQNVHIFNETNSPIIALGLKDIIISASPDGILVSEKQESDSLKKYVENINQTSMFEEMIWGNYKVLDFENKNNGLNYLIKHITINSNHSLSFEVDNHIEKNELLAVIKGFGTVEMNGQKKRISKGDFIYVVPNEFCTIESESELHIIDIQWE